MSVAQIGNGNDLLFRSCGIVSTVPLQNRVVVQRFRLDEHNLAVERDHIASCEQGTPYMNQSVLLYRSPAVCLKIQMHRIDNGASGSIYPARILDNQRSFVAKVVHKSPDDDPLDFQFRIDSLTTEHQLLQLLRDATCGIVRCPSIYYLGNGLSFFILEQYDGSLEDWLPFLPLQTRYKYFDQLVKGLEYMHRFGIDHADISLPNCLVKLQLEECVLADLGCASCEGKLPNSWSVGEYYPREDCTFGKTLRRQYNETNDNAHLVRLHQHRRAQDVFALRILAEKMFYRSRGEISPAFRSLIEQMRVGNWEARLKASDVLNSWQAIYAPQ